VSLTVLFTILMCQVRCSPGRINPDVCLEANINLPPKLEMLCAKLLAHYLVPQDSQIEGATYGTGIKRNNEDRHVFLRFGRG